MDAALQLPYEKPQRSAAHPNELDRKRIERALKNRKRYRYVQPQVIAESGGYRIVSPCCSRNIDREGGVIDIAMLRYSMERHQWRVYRRDHTLEAWVYVAEAERISDLLAEINEDLLRIFWP